MRAKYNSIRKALNNGYVTSYYGNTDIFNKRKIQFIVRYNEPRKCRGGWSVTSEWYECSESYFNRFVRNHRNFKI